MAVASLKSSWAAVPVAFHILRAAQRASPFFCRVRVQSRHVARYCARSNAQGPCYARLLVPLEKHVHYLRTALRCHSLSPCVVMTPPPGTPCGGLRICPIAPILAHLC